ncbi:nitrate- and nitrite sensing domain-containing protein [Echinimonas agarilytica]|uniref:Nitrate- and nitrite sensing domain-containing protein n=1 Tax=Echinimonas agarilytica TaxID=1215918 RepID=A0AA41W540_9GAMM|nr:nitrate- and nitrite sensing domain-containing protein [Echinimonas agarilytica]MCM2679066.1 nitrate- and nitrite sensing domain-containing protein [Echinimonas agarilytica]
MDIITLPLTVCAMLVLLAVFSILKIRRSHARHLARYQHGIEWLQSLRAFLTPMQQHRGLTTAFLNGDKDMAIKIGQVQQQIERQIRALKSQGDWISSTSRWEGILDHWQRLSANYINHTPSYSLEQHNRLILNILHLIEDCAEQHHLQELTIDGQLSAEHLWQSLLFNAEFIGQARALGTGVAAAHHCGSVERIRLKYLHSKLSSYNQVCNNNLCRTKLTPLLASIQNEITIQEPSITATKYFGIATDALETVMKEFDAGLLQVRQQAQKHAS